MDYAVVNRIITHFKLIFDHHYTSPRWQEKKIEAKRRSRLANLKTKLISIIKESLLNIVEGINRFF